MIRSVNLQAFFCRIRRAAAIFLPLLSTFFLLALEIKAQPGGCYYATWRADYCREERTAAIKNYEAALKRQDEKISAQPRSAENYYERGKIYTDVLSKGLSAEFDGAVYFEDAEARMFADFDTAARLNPKPEYLNARGKVHARFWERELSDFSYRRDGKYKSPEEIGEDIYRFLLDNENFKAAERDFLKCIELSGRKNESFALCEGYAGIRATRAFHLGDNEYVAALIGKSKAADTALADIDYSIEAARASSIKYGTGSSLIRVCLVDKARAAKRFGRDDAALAALDEAEKSLADDKDQFCQIYSTRAAIFVKQRKFDLALKAADTAVAGSQYWICQSLLEVRGDIYRDRGATDKAVEDYSTLLKTDSTLFSRVYWKRGKLYMQKGEYDRAVADFTAVIDNASICVNDYELRAKAFRLAGNEAAAAEDDKKVLQMTKDAKYYQPSIYCSHHAQ